MCYSGSGPLTAATPDSFISKQLGAPLPISETTFSTWNLIAIVATIVVVGLALYLVAPRGDDKIFELATDAREKLIELDDEVSTPADRVDASRIPTLLLGLMLLAYLIIHFTKDGTLTLDVVNWSFLCLILLLVRNPFELMALTKNAASNVGETLLQFPLYAGILGIMTGTGLIEVISEVMISISTPQTFGLLAFLSAGVVNFFVPSGGGQFAVQAPIMLSAGSQLGVDSVHSHHGHRVRGPVDQYDPAVLGFAPFGDRWTQNARYPRLHHNRAHCFRVGLWSDHADHFDVVVPSDYPRGRRGSMTVQLKHLAGRFLSGEIQGTLACPKVSGTWTLDVNSAQVLFS